MHDAERDGELDEIVAAYADRLNTGERIDPGEILRQHPGRGPEILLQLRAFVSLTADSELADEGGATLGILGDYTLRRELGRGGMGVVYEAWQHSLDRRVALKVLPAGIAADPKSSMRFLREAQIAAKLQHPHIVAVHASGVEGSTPYYAMDLIEGDTLSRVLAQMRESAADVPTPFGPARTEQELYLRVARAFAGVAEGLQHAHEHKVIHRDLKPSNLILERGGRLKILDFGLAHLEGQETITLAGDVLGTPQYMSPEQARRKKVKVDHRTDIWSLGATLYEVITGQPPFLGKDHHDTLSRIISDEPNPPRRIEPRVPVDLETIVLKCLRKEAADRYGTAEALGQDLRRFVRGDAVEAKPETRWATLERRIRRHRTGLIVGAIVFLLVIVGLASSVALVTRAYQLATAERDTAVKERNQRIQQLYRANVRLADQDWKAANFSRFVALLDDFVPLPGESDLRGWEWYYLKSLDRDNRQLEIQADAQGVVAIAWSPDGTRIASGGADGVVRIWDARSGAILLELDSRGSTIMALAWTRTGERIAAVTQDGWVNAWNPSNGAELYSQPPRVEQPPRCEQRSVAWSPDGSVLVSGSVVGAIDVRDGESGEILRILPTSEASCAPMVSWSPDGSLVAAATRVSGQVVIWNEETWEEVHRIETGRPFLYTSAWSPDGAELATSSSIRTVKIWSTCSWEARESLDADRGGVVSLDWSHAGLVSAGYDSVVRLWDADNWRVSRRFLGNSSMVWNVRSYSS